MARLKLALVREQYRPDGGAEQFVMRALEGLTKEGLDVSIITRRWPGGESRGYRVVEVTSTGLSRVARHRQFCRAVTEALRCHCFDIVQSHERLPGCQIYRAGDGVHKEWVETRQRTSSRLKSTLLDLDSFHRYMIATERTLFENPELKKVICISSMVKEDILRHYDVTPEKLCIIYNGIDTTRFVPPISRLDKAKRRASLGLPIDRRILIFAGSGFARKGVEQILHAMALLPSDDLLLVVGKDKSARAYHRLAQRLGIAARVRFLGVRNDLADLLAAADVLLHPALYEPFGNVVLEALACGCGVIVSDRVGAKDLVSEGENGYICEPMNAQSIVDCLNSCTTQERLASLAEHARRTALHYDISAMSTQLRALYTSLLR